MRVAVVLLLSALVGVQCAPNLLKGGFSGLLPKGPMSLPLGGLGGDKGHSSLGLPLGGLGGDKGHSSLGLPLGGLGGDKGHSSLGLPLGGLGGDKGHSNLLVSTTENVLSLNKQKEKLHEQCGSSEQHNSASNEDHNLLKGAISKMLPKEPLNIPLGGLGGDKDPSTLQVTLTEDGVGLNKHKERHYEKCDRSEQHSSASNEDHSSDGSSSHDSQNQTQAAKLHTSRKSSTDVEDSGMTLSLKGLSLYDSEEHSEDQETEDRESEKTSSVQTDKTGNSQHRSASGSETSKTSRCKDHKQQSKKSQLCLGAGGGGLFKSESSASAKHDASSQESGESWSDTNDTSKEGNCKRTASSHKDSKYAKATNNSSAECTKDTEQRTIPAHN